MEDVLESLLFFDELSPKRRDELRRQVADDPELADALAHWKDVHRRVRERFRDDLPDRRLLVLYALEQGGYGDVLDAGEREALDAARADVEAAIDAHPALEDVIATIQDEVADFDAAWQEHGASVAAGADPAEDVGEIDETVGAAEGDGRMGAREDRSARAPQSQNFSRFARRLATGALLAFAAVLVWFVWPSSPQVNTVTVAEGDARRLNLVDGSTVRLIGAAEMTFEESRSESFDRRVTLEYGRAFFKIQEQKRPEPFIVETPTATATVLGTQFGVAANADSTSVVLASGKVEVDARESTGESAVVLEPGQHSRVVRGSAPSQPQSVNVAQALAWSGLFVFRSTPVDQIADRLRTFYDVEITVADALQGEPVTGTFDQTQPPEQILEAVAAALNGSVEGSKDEGFTITK